MTQDHCDMAMFEPISGEKSDREIALSVRLLCRTVDFEFVQPCGTSSGEEASNVDEENIPLEPNDIQRMILPENGWLNDLMINRAMNFLNKKHLLQRPNGERISWDVWRAKTMPTYWSTFIERGDHYSQWMTDWMKDQGLTKGKKPKLNCVIIPCFHSSHWTLAAVFPLYHTIAMVDSLVGHLPANRAATVYGHICKWLHAHMEDDFHEQEWTLIQLSCPQLENSHDCGIHVALNAWCISKGIWPMAHKDVTPGDRRLFVADMVSTGTKDCPVVVREGL